ncbi:FAD-binding oxidoreductase [Candidatus Saccharibacteria bacterium]|nr:FAD-binding oxidoreductase [Candidatus Saccharibacteria bacterium]
MSKVAHYLQEHLVGEVITSPDARRYFSTDASIFNLTPAIVVYPRNENDVRKTARFTWQLAERGRIIPITARGHGTDQSGAAIGSGIMLIFPAYMNKVLELDPKSGSVAVQPGLNYGKLQQTLHTHGRFLPPFPASMEYSTLGGAIGNNAGGEKSVKYGSTREYVRNLRVVLANGEVIETRRLNKRELSKKMGLSSFEGEVYRALDTLIEEQRDLVVKSKLEVSKNSSGYNLADIKNKDGSFDLTPLFVGSQGTLGLVTEAIMETETFNPQSSLISASFNSIDDAAKAVAELRKLPAIPSAMEMVDEHLITFIEQHNPNQLKGLVDKPYHKLILLVEFDDANQRVQKRNVKKALKILDRYNAVCKVETETEQQEQFWKIRHAAASVASYHDGNTKALPIIEDGIVPVDRFGEYIEKVYELFAKHHLQVALWGHAGNGNLHMQPMLDLAQLGDRQKIFRLMDEYHKLVIELGGSLSGEHGDGRLRGPYLEQLYGPQIYELFTKVKAIFDPHGILNPGVKTGITLDDIKPLLRSEYTLDHLYDHLPRT